MNAKVYNGTPKYPSITHTQQIQITGHIIASAAATRPVSRSLEEAYRCPPPRWHCPWRTRVDARGSRSPPGPPLYRPVGSLFRWSSVQIMVYGVLLTCGVLIGPMWCYMMGSLSAMRWRASRRMGRREVAGGDRWVTVRCEARWYLV